jgi:hypothetical protein
MATASTVLVLGQFTGAATRVPEMKPAGSPDPQLHEDGAHQLQIVLHAYTILSHSTRCTQCQHSQSCDAQGDVLMLYVLHFQTPVASKVLLHSGFCSHVA